MDGRRVDRLAAAPLHLDRHLEREYGSCLPRLPDASYVTGGLLARWFDLVVHRQTVTPWQPL